MQYVALQGCSPFRYTKQYGLENPVADYLHEWKHDIEHSEKLVKMRNTLYFIQGLQQGHTKNTVKYARVDNMQFSVAHDAVRYYNKCSFVVTQDTYKRHKKARSHRKVVVKKIYW